MIIEKCHIIANQQLYSRFYEMELEAPQIAAVAKPGQFIMVKIGTAYDPFLKRPMGVSCICGDHIKFIYQVKGRGTELLSQMSVADSLEVNGPIGNGWRMADDCQKALIIGGGVGITPLMPLLQELVGRGVSCDLLWGAAEKGQLFNYQEVDKLATVQVATEDGSCGIKGYVTLLLPQNPTYDMVYCCGPKVLMAAVAKWAEEKNQPCQVSLEERMGCGIGTCMGCVCKTKSGDQEVYKRVCCDGPVFDSREVVF